MRTVRHLILPAALLLGALLSPNVWTARAQPLPSTAFTRNLLRAPTQAAAQAILGLGTNNAALTNLTLVSSVDAPMGAWFTNNLGDGATLTGANVGSISNAGDGMILAHTNGTTAVTNSIRMRFGLPWDWNAGTVKIGLVSVCSGTNSSFTTNIVYAVRAVALGQNDNVTSPTWGSIVRTTNNVSTNSWVQGSEAITAALTVGNTPTVAKDILWEIQRHGGDGGDTETNANLFLARVRVYYQRATRADFPTSSP